MDIVVSEAVTLDVIVPKRLFHRDSVCTCSCLSQVGSVQKNVCPLWITRLPQKRQMSISHVVFLTQSGILKAPKLSIDILETF